MEDLAILFPTYTKLEEKYRANNSYSRIFETYKMNLFSNKYNYIFKNLGIRPRYL
jgi:hypothetical protein